MKVLFVCNGNVGRSQAAMEFYNQLRPGDAASAGTQVDVPGQKIGERFGAAQILVAMQEHGIDMGQNQRQPLTQGMAKGYDKIIMMADPETVPDYLKDDERVEYWEIPDAKDATLEKSRDVRDQIKAKVEDLVQRTRGL